MAALTRLRAVIFGGAWWRERSWQLGQMAPSGLQVTRLIKIVLGLEAFDHAFDLFDVLARERLTPVRPSVFASDLILDP